MSTYSRLVVATAPCTFFDGTHMTKKAAQISATLLLFVVMSCPGAREDGHSGREQRGGWWFSSFSHIWWSQGLARR